jgi:hypothetical protein
MLILPKLICCDEAGFTGDRMLDPHQPYFSYASHDLDLKEAEAVLARARHRYPVQMPELKATRLLKTERGRDLRNHPASTAAGSDQAAAAWGWDVFQCQGSSSCNLAAG